MAFFAWKSHQAVFGQRTGKKNRFFTPSQKYATQYIVSEKGSGKAEGY
jgi:hypothetical protein